MKAVLNYKRLGKSQLLFLECFQVKYTKPALITIGSNKKMYCTQRIIKYKMSMPSI